MPTSAEVFVAQFLVWVLKALQSLFAPDSAVSQIIADFEADLETDEGETPPVTPPAPPPVTPPAPPPVTPPAPPPVTPPAQPVGTLIGPPPTVQPSPTEGTPAPQFTTRGVAKQSSTTGMINPK